MASAREMRERAERARDSVIDIAASCIEKHLDEIVAFIQEQLLLGQDKNGELLTPSYSQDPFFKKPGAAEKYAKWKKQLWPGSRPEDTPNLIITGKFHDGIKALLRGNQIDYVNDVNFAQEVIQKYGDQIFGLNDENCKKLWETIRPEFIDKLNEILVLD